MRKLTLRFTNAEVIHFEECGFIGVMKGSRIPKDSYSKYNREFKTFVPNTKEYAPYIDIHTMANVLSVLTNKQTISRKAIYRTKREFDINALTTAKTARITLTTIPTKMTIQFRKYLKGNNQWLPSSNIIIYGDTPYQVNCGILTWERFLNYFNETELKAFTELAKKYVGDNYRSVPIAKIFTILNKNKSNSDIRAVTEQDNNITVRKLKYKEPLRDLILGPNENGIIKAMNGMTQDGNPLVARQVGLFPFTVIDTNGNIELTIDDKFYEDLTNGPGFANILEGGMVYIKSIEDIYEDFKPNIYPFEPTNLNKYKFEQILARKEERELKKKEKK